VRKEETHHSIPGWRGCPSLAYIEGETHHSYKCLVIAAVVGMADAADIVAAANLTAAADVAASAE
jgi:hypothetical protein